MFADLRKLIRETESTRCIPSRVEHTRGVRSRPLLLLHTIARTNFFFPPFSEEIIFMYKRARAYIIGGFG